MNVDEYLEVARHIFNREISRLVNPAPRHRHPTAHDKGRRVGDERLRQAV